MIDDSDGPRLHGENDPILYDWYKHLTSLSVLTLGGVLSLSQLPDAGEIKKPILIGVLVALAAAGVCSFSGAEQIVRARTSNLPLPRSALQLQKLATITFSAGVGAFLYIFVKAMN
jgi:hypothetical protein